MSEGKPATKTTFVVNSKGKFFTKVTEQYLRQEVPTGWLECEMDETPKGRVILNRCTQIGE